MLNKLVLTFDPRGMLFELCSRYVTRRDVFAYLISLNKCNQISKNRLPPHLVDEPGTP